MNLSWAAMVLWATGTESRATMDTILKVAPLVPAFLAAMFKLLEDHGRQTHKAALIESISKLAKNISELPELPPSDRSTTSKVREAFQVELERSYEELTALQRRSPKRAVGFSSITAGLRSALLLYRPRGAAAWFLHLAFYGCLLFFAFMTIGVVAGASDPTSYHVTPGVTIVIYTILGIPPLILRYFAIKIHRRQCAASEGGQVREVATA